MAVRRQSSRIMKISVAGRMKMLDASPDSVSSIMFADLEDVVAEAAQHIFNRRWVKKLTDCLSSRS